ncbi:AT-hook motif nuclear-localized protein 17-like [Populus alba x Populus x berolinensis]|nr:AT-hook motif nuclear-localized protein 17-like [Populus alba x Populus x berolinensis]
MADHFGGAISLSRELSHNSDDSSSDHSPRSVPTLSATPVTADSPSRLGRPHNNTSPDDHIHHNNIQSVQIQRKPRGRPPGSKNRPKPPIIITKDCESSMKPAILEISAGSDVIETIVNFARRNHAGISVISATGSVANVTLRHPVSHTPSLSLHGPFNLLALFGSVVGPLATNKASCASPPPGSAVHSCSSFGISLAGAQGQVFGGIVAGKVMAATQVVVVAATFLNPTFHRLPGENDEAEQETKPSVGGGPASESCVSTGMSMAVYGVANPTPVNCQMSPPEIMHWPVNLVHKYVRKFLCNPEEEGWHLHAGGAEPSVGSLNPMGKVRVFTFSQAIKAHMQICLNGSKILYPKLSTSAVGYN